MLIRRPPAREKALPRAAAKAKFNTVYLTSNYTATHIKVFCSTYCTCLHFLVLQSVHVHFIGSSVRMPLSCLYPTTWVCGLSSGVPVQGRPRQVHRTRGVHPHDQGHHHSDSQGSGCRQLCSAGGRDRHCQPEPQSHLRYADYLQGANPHQVARTSHRQHQAAREHVSPAC